MSRVRGQGNRSTEVVVADFVKQAMPEHEMVSHPRDVPGRPDLYFPRLRVAVFVDGCFWHGCPTCKRNTPSTRSEFWSAKIRANRARDRRVTGELRGQGVVVMRIWEHSQP
jgi:DNA mismatch endonuclease (patch repair protein)